MPPAGLPSRQLPRLRFSLLALLLFVAVACLALAWFASPQRVVVEALFQVDSMRPGLLDKGSSRFDAFEYRIFQKSQVEFFKSAFLLNAALREPSVANLPIVSAQGDPASWLADHFEVGYREGSEILYIRMHGTQSEANDLSLIINSVTKAYEKEVIYHEKQKRLAMRDAIFRAANELGERIVKQKTSVENLRKEAAGEGSTSPADELKQIDLEILIEAYRQLRTRLELEDIESFAPSRIRQIQPAFVSPD